MYIYLPLLYSRPEYDPAGNGGERSEKSLGWTRKFGKGGEIISGRRFTCLDWTRDSTS